MTQPDPDAPATEPPQPPADDAGEKLVLNSPEEARTAKDFLLWAGVILLAVLSAYSPALHGQFVWDDDRHVEQNRTLRDAGGLWNIWTGHWRLLLGGEGERGRPFTPQYYPLTHTSFWLEYQLTGQRAGEINPVVFHVTNGVLHAAAAILLWFLLRELAVPGSWVIAAIFALHPIQVESVAWISERKNVLSGAFFVASLLAYVKAGRSRFGFRVSGFGERLGPAAAPSSPDTRSPTPETRSWLYWLALVLFLCAVLSKTVACAMPAVVLVLIWWKRGTLRGRDVLPLVPFFVIGLVMAAMTGWVERNFVGARGPEWDLSVAQRVLIAGRAAWFYVGKILWPVGLTFMYPRWNVDPRQLWQWAFPLLAAAVPVALLALRNRIGRGPLAAVLIYLGVLVPAMGFVNIYPMRYSFVANHFQYHAGPALMALVVATAAILLRRIRGETASGDTRAAPGLTTSSVPSAAPAPGSSVPSASAPSAVPYVLAGAVLAALTVGTALHARTFASQVSLWADVVRKNPFSWMARNNYGTALLGASQLLGPDQAEQANQMLDDAAAQFEQAVTIRPEHDRAWANWGRLLLLRGRPQEALAKLDQSLALRPGGIDALIDRGRALLELRQLPEARQAFEQVLAASRAQPVASGTLALAHQFLSRIARQQDDAAAALDHLARAVQLAPRDPAIQYDYGRLLIAQGRLEDAAAALAAAIRVQPDNLDPHIDLALVFLKVGNHRGAYTRLAEIGVLTERMGLEPTKEQGERLLAAGRVWRQQFEASTRPAATGPSLPTASTVPSTQQMRAELDRLLLHERAAATAPVATTAPAGRPPAP